MTSTSSTPPSAARQGHEGAKGPDELRQQIAETRARLGDTVEELAAKADVKARAQAQMADLKGAASHAARSVRERVPVAAVAGGVGVAVVVAVGVYLWRRH
ncbi:hypothetical protein GCM10010145_56750 [Streptomyces ruber]|uniref:DUF3618 domain-containing protein n=2 Tax=Streptomyces TaxID=1883 RepID=A0A918EWU2_9ACTN|nr:DUF3618 domain-containing protein [Streptomyces ruber]GGQ79755.1 hypothetical protein GCM10010145_56750 [Streptomyces ruber]